MKVKVRTNLCAGIFSLVLAAAIWLAIPYQIGEPGDTIATNPRLFPQIFCGLIAVVGGVLIFTSLLLHKEEIKELDLKTQGIKLLYYVIVAAYIFSISVFGFLIPSIVFAIVTLLYCKCRKPLYYVAIVLFAVALYLVFAYVLGVRFP